MGHQKDIHHVGQRRHSKKPLTKGVAFFLLFLLLFTGLLTGCGNDEGGGGAGSTAPAQSSATGGSTEEVKATRIFTDDCGRDVEVPNEITTVIASGPLAQITLFAVAPDLLLAINGAWTEDATDYVDEVYLDLPEVGSFFGNHDLNYEEIVRLDPDIIIDVGEDKPSMKSDLEDITKKTGIPAVHITGYIDHLDQTFTRLGDLLGREEAGADLAEYCKEANELVDATLAKVETKIRVLDCTGEDGLNVLAKGSYHAEVLDQLADNVAVLEDPSSQGSGNEVNLEQMMIWEPEVILFGPNSYYDYVADDPAWGSLQAIQSKRYYEIPAGPYNWMGSPPSSNRVLGMLWLAALLYPEEVGFDIKEKTIEYYRLFYHCDLTDAQYEALIKHSITKRSKEK